MAQRINLAVKGKYIIDENGKMFFSGMDVEGKPCNIGIVKKDGQNRVSANKDDLAAMFAKSLTASMKQRYGNEWEGNKEATAEYEVKMARYLDKDSIMMFSQVGGMFDNNGVFEGQSNAEMVTVEAGTNTGTFLTIKPVEIGSENKPAMSVDVSYTQSVETADGYKNRAITLEDVLLKRVNLSKVNITAETNAFSTVEDIEELVAMQKDFLNYRAEQIESNGEAPVFGAYSQGKTNIMSPTLFPYVSKSDVYAFFGGQAGMLEKIFEVYPNATIERVMTSGEVVLITSANVKELIEKEGGAVSKEMSQFEAALPFDQLTAALTDNEAIVTKAKRIAEYMAIVDGMNSKKTSDITLEGYYASLDKLISMLKENGMNNAPVNFTFRVMTGQNNRMNENGYVSRMEGAVSKMLEAAKESYIRALKAVIMKYTTDAPLKGAYIGTVKEKIAEYLNVKVGDGNKKELSFKKLSNGSTLASQFKFNKLHMKIDLPQPFTTADNRTVSSSYFSAFTVPKTPGGDNYESLSSLKGSLPSSNIDLAFSNKFGIPVKFNTAPKERVSEVTVSLGDVVKPKEREIAPVVAKETIVVDVEPQTKVVTEHSDGAVEEQETEIDMVEENPATIDETIEDDTMEASELLMALENDDYIADSEDDIEQAVSAAEHPSQGYLDI